MSALDKIQQHLQAAEQIAKDELGVNNIFYNEAFIETFMASRLDHTF